MQNKLNAELARVQYYTSIANQEELLSLLLTTNKNIEVNSNISVTTSATGNAQVDSIEKEKTELRQKLLNHQITPSDFYANKLAIDSRQYREHFNDYNNLNRELLNKLEKNSPWTFWSNLFTLFELILILVTVIGQSYLIFLNKNSNTNL